MVRTRFGLILAFFKPMKTWYGFCLCWRYFSHRLLRLKNWSVVLLSALNPACSSAIISSAWGLKPIQDDFQHDFARMTDEADSSEVF